MLLMGCGQTAKYLPPGCGLTALLTALLIYAPQIKIPHPVKSTWTGDFFSGASQDFGRIGRHEVVRIHQLPPTERYFERGIALFVFLNFAGIALVDSNSPGPAVTSRGAKMPQWGIFRARLANPPAPTKKDPQLRLRVFFCAVRSENSFQTKNVQAQRLAQLLS